MTRPPVETWHDWEDREKLWVADSIAVAIAEAKRNIRPSAHPGMDWATILIAGADALADFRILFADHKPEGNPCD